MGPNGKKMSERFLDSAWPSGRVVIRFGLRCDSARMCWSARVSRCVPRAWGGGGVLMSRAGRRPRRAKGPELEGDPGGQCFLRVYTNRLGLVLNHFRASADTATLSDFESMVWEKHFLFNIGS